MLLNSGFIVEGVPTQTTMEPRKMTMPPAKENVLPTRPPQNTIFSPCFSEFGHYASLKYIPTNNAIFGPTNAHFENPRTEGAPSEKKWLD